MKLMDCTNSKELKTYLSQVLSRTGSVGKKEKTLNRYLTADSALALFEKGFIKLGTSDHMNDCLEHEMLKAAQKDRRMSFSCFSGSEENIAMYKMYASAHNGVMLSMTYESAEQILAQLPLVLSSGKRLVPILRGGELSDTRIEAEVYWTAVCYKELKNERLWSGTVFNDYIQQPLRDYELAGLVKLRGWEYEKEIRLIVETEKPLKEYERIVIPLPKNIEKGILVTTRPGFDRKKNTAVLSAFKRMGITVRNSEYDALVDIGDKD